MEIEHKETTLAITMDMTPQQAAEAFIATIRGAQVVDHKPAPNASQARLEQPPAQPAEGRPAAILGPAERTFPAKRSAALAPPTAAG